MRKTKTYVPQVLCQLVLTCLEPETPHGIPQARVNIGMNCGHVVFAQPKLNISLGLAFKLSSDRLSLSPFPLLLTRTGDNNWNIYMMGDSSVQVGGQVEGERGCVVDHTRTFDPEACVGCKFELTDAYLFGKGPLLKTLVSPSQPDLKIHASSFRIRTAFRMLLLFLMDHPERSQMVGRTSRQSCTN